MRLPSTPTTGPVPGPDRWPLPSVSDLIHFLLIPILIILWSTGGGEAWPFFFAYGNEAALALSVYLIAHSTILTFGDWFTSALVSVWFKVPTQLLYSASTLFRLSFHLRDIVESILSLLALMCMPFAHLLHPRRAMGYESVFAGDAFSLESLLLPLFLHLLYVLFGAVSLLSSAAVIFLWEPVIGVAIDLLFVGFIMEKSGTFLVHYIEVFIFIIIINLALKIVTYWLYPKSTDDAPVLGGNTEGDAWIGSRWSGTFIVQLAQKAPDPSCLLLFAALGFPMAAAGEQQKLHLSRPGPLHTFLPTTASRAAPRPSSAS